MSTPVDIYKDMKRWRRATAFLLFVIALGLAFTIGLALGAESAPSVADCDGDEVVTLEWTGRNAEGDGTGVLSVGDCERVDEAAFIAAVEALTATGPGSEPAEDKTKAEDGAEESADEDGESDQSAEDPAAETADEDS